MPLQDENLPVGVSRAGNSYSGFTPVAPQAAIQTPNVSAPQTPNYMLTPGLRSAFQTDIGTALSQLRSATSPAQRAAARNTLAALTNASAGLAGTRDYAADAGAVSAMQSSPLSAPAPAVRRGPVKINTNWVTDAGDDPYSFNAGLSGDTSSITQSVLGQYADGGAVGAPGIDASHPLYQKYILAMHRAGMLAQAQPPEAVIPRMAQYEAKQRLAMAQQTVNGGTQNYAQGGAVDVGGAQVFGPGTGKSDSIPAMIDGEHPAALSTGEFVFPKRAVEFYGTKVLDAMVLKAKQATKLKG